MVDAEPLTAADYGYIIEALRYAHERIEASKNHANYEQKRRSLDENEVVVAKVRALRNALRGS